MTCQEVWRKGRRRKVADLLSAGSSRVASTNYAAAGCTKIQQVVQLLSPLPQTAMALGSLLDLARMTNSQFGAYAEGSRRGAYEACSTGFKSRMPCQTHCRSGLCRRIEARRLLTSLNRVRVPEPLPTNQIKELTLWLS